MKRLLLLSALFICFLCQAQDYDYILKLKKIDSVEVDNVAKEIASFSTNKLRLYKRVETASMHTLRYVFVPISLTDDQLKNGQYDEKTGLDFVTIDFAFYIEGVKKYRLNDISADYLTLFPYWKKYFMPSAEKNEALTNYKMQKLKNTELKVYSYIRKDELLWSFHNS